MTVRSSTRGLPGLPRGRCGLSAFQASSDSQNKLFAMTIALQRLKSGVNIQSKSINCMGSQPKTPTWFALNDDRPLCAFAGIPDDPANRDPVEYDAPSEVVLDRPAPRHHLAFGRGIHHCVGAPLARLEGRVVLTTLLERTRDITLDPAQPPRWVRSLQARRHERLPIRLVAR